MIHNKTICHPHNRLEPQNKAYKFLRCLCCYIDHYVLKPSPVCILTTALRKVRPVPTPPYVVSLQATRLILVMTKSSLTFELRAGFLYQANKSQSAQSGISCPNLLLIDH